MIYFILMFASKAQTLSFGQVFALGIGYKGRCYIAIKKNALVNISPQSITDDEDTCEGCKEKHSLYPNRLHDHPVENLWFPYFTKKKTATQKC